MFGGGVRLFSHWIFLACYRKEMKYDQSMRGEAGYKERVALRASTHKTWRQMKGMERVMNEVRIKTDLNVSRFRERISRCLLFLADKTTWCLPLCDGLRHYQRCLLLPSFQLRLYG